MAEHHEHHLMSFKTHMNVFIGLIILTVTTVVVALFDFGEFANTFIAILIATIKASLVIAWFMHLKYDGLMNRIIFGSAFFFLLVLAVINLLDIYTRIDPRA